MEETKESPRPAVRTWAVVLGAATMAIALDFAIWWLVFNGPPNTPRFYAYLSANSNGCYDLRPDDRRTEFFLGNHQVSLVRDWLMNHLCGVGLAIPGLRDRLLEREESPSHLEMDPGELPKSLRNKSVNSNTARIPEGWSTYKSSDSALVAFSRLDPAFTVSFPSGWTVDEELRGLILSESGSNKLEPQIVISRSTEPMPGDVIAECKARLESDPPEIEYDEVKRVHVSGIESAYLSYHVPTTTQTHPSARDGILVCIPLPNGLDELSAQPRSSDLAQQYFDEVLSTYRLVPTNTNTVTPNTRRYTNTRFAFSLTLPASWGRISEFDGTLDLDLDRASTQASMSVVFGGQPSTNQLAYFAHKDRTVDEFLAADTIPTGQGDKKLVLGSAPMTTATGLSGIRVSYDRSLIGYDTAVVLERGPHLLEFRYDATDADASTAIDTLTLSPNYETPTIRYKDATYGFTLDFPQSWRGFSHENRTAGGITFVDFEHPLHQSSDDRPGIVSFGINVQPLGDPLPRGAQLITSRGGKQYSFNHGTGATPGELHDLWLQIEFIVATLEVI